MEHIEGVKQLADLLMKPLDRVRFETLHDMDVRVY